ncbi:hypothetical protein DL96DRAFT_1670936 [Flagelloscypha sp. PMI_526]|nr:hypothetical protein DL96DRAFT_1670936 [Flagelloscypha sp. PMI_526]
MAHRVLAFNRPEWLGVNFIDTYFRKGLYPLKEFPAQIGSEAAGTVFALPTDPAVLNDPKFQRLGFKVGSRVVIVNYVNVPWLSTYPIPDSVDTRTASASLSSGLTALTFVEEAYNVQPGDTVFVHAVAGSFGLLLTQIAKHKGAIVIGTTSTEEKAKLAKENGADHVILYTKEDRLPGGEGVNVIYDGVGKDSFDANFEFIKRKGTLVSVGNSSGANVRLLRPVDKGLETTFATADEQYEYGTRLWDLVTKGVFKIRVYQEYPFTREGVIQTQKDITSRKTVGKLLIKVE